MAVDHAGHALAVGDVVKLEATIASINDNDTHFQNVTLTITYPNTDGTPPYPIMDGQNVNLPGPIPATTLRVYGKQVTYVSGP